MYILKKNLHFDRYKNTPKHDTDNEPFVKVAFRISLAHTKEPYAISAWLRKGDLQAAELSANDYNEKNFKNALPDIKSVMAKHPADFSKKLQSICLSAGVKVVYTPCLPKAPIVGSTRWLNDTPLIQLSGRYKRNDSFWFTFFHEAGHIILHGKKDIFLKKIDYSDFDKSKEEEADNFAIKWTLTKEEEQEIIDSEGNPHQDPAPGVSGLIYPVHSVPASHHENES